MKIRLLFDQLPVPLALPVVHALRVILPLLLSHGSVCYADQTHAQNQTVLLPVGLGRFFIDYRAVILGF